MKVALCERDRTQESCLVTGCTFLAETKALISLIPLSVPLLLASDGKLIAGRALDTGMHPLLILNMTLKQILTDTILRRFVCLKALPRVEFAQDHLFT